MIDKALKLLYRKRLMLCDFRQIESICNGEYNTTISQTVADFFAKHKANVKPEGIGWRITL